MFTVELFTNTISKILKKLKCPSIDKDKEDVVHLCLCVYVYTQVSVVKIRQSVLGYFAPSCFFLSYSWNKNETLYTYIHTQWNIIQSLKKNEILPFATRWMDLEGIICFKIPQNVGGCGGMVGVWIIVKKQDLFISWALLKLSDGNMAFTLLFIYLVILIPEINPKERLRTKNRLLYKIGHSMLISRFIRLKY